VLHKGVPAALPNADASCALQLLDPDLWVVLFNDLSDFETENNRGREIKKQDSGKQLSHFLNAACRSAASPQSQKPPKGNRPANQRAYFGE
jgi:hypothetical protein